MKLPYLQLLLSIAVQALTSDYFEVRRRETEFNIRPRHGYNARNYGTVFSRTLGEKQEASCGSGKEPCPLGQCCSASGKCGASKEYCYGPQCQIQYSNGNCDASQRPAGSSTVNVPRNNAGSVAYDKYIVACTEPGTIALTFDDGPYKYTDHILDLLDQYEIKATFFITGNNLGKSPIDDENMPWPGTLRRMHASGHQLASHSWTHQDLSAATNEIREQQIIYNEMAFRNIFGWFPKYLRPPYGTCSRDTGCLDYVTKLGYHVVNFNIDTKDYDNNTPEKIQASKFIFENGLADKTQGYIELSHDIQQQTAYNLTEFMVKTMQEKGFRAVTVAECLGDSKENWYVDAGGSGDEGGTCGWRSGCRYFCKGSTYGGCCSYHGYCGKSSGPCDGGCLADCGACSKPLKDDPCCLGESENGLWYENFGQGCVG